MVSFLRFSPISRSQWLLYLGVGLILIHLLLTWGVTGRTDQLVLNGLFWGAIAAHLWQRRHTLILTSDRVPQFLGLALVGGLLAASLMPPQLLASSLIRVFPGLIALSVGLIASGRHLTQYGKEFILVLTMMVPQGAISLAVEHWIGLPIQTLIAQCATFLLHYLSWDVTRQGVEVILPQGAVEVRYACTGVPILILLLQLSTLLLVTFPVRLSQRVIILFISGAIALLLSSSRVALMTVFVSHRETFDYWHGNQGSEIFSTLAIVLFAISCQPLIGDEPNGDEPKQM